MQAFCQTPEKEAEYLAAQEFDFLTDWTFAHPFPLDSLLREGERLKRDYGKKGYTRFLIYFCHCHKHGGHLDLWGKKEKDFEI